MLDLKLMKKWRQLSKKQKIVVVVCLGVILIVFTLLIVRKLKKQDKIPGSFSPLVKITMAPFLPKLTDSSKETMKEIFSYFETQYREDGFYNYLSHYEEQCEQKDSKIICPFEGKKMFETTNAWTALAYLAGYQTFDDQKYLDLANKDTDKLLNYCQNEPGECLWVLVQMAKLYQETNDPRLLTFLKNEGEILLTTSDPAPLLLDIEARQLAILYKTTKDGRYLQEAKKRLQMIEDTLTQREVIYQTADFSFPQSGCWWTLAQLELGKNSSERTYLEKARSFIDKANINSPANFGQFFHPVEIQPCIEAFFEMAEITGKISYYQQGKLLLEKFLETFWDGEKQNLVYGEGGTIFNPYPKTRPFSQKYVSLSDSCYSAWLLAGEVSRRSADSAD